MLEKLEPKEGAMVKELLNPRFQLGSIFEGAISFNDLELKGRDIFGFQLIIEQYGHKVEIFPHTKIIEVEVPDEHYYSREWSV